MRKEDLKALMKIAAGIALLAMFFTALMCAVIFEFFT